MICPTSLSKSRLMLCAALLFTVSAFQGVQQANAQTCAPGTGIKITVHPTDDVQSIVNSSPCGSTFIFAPGTYANLTIYPINEAANPIDGDTFKGQYTRTSSTPSILSGATTVSNFTQQGSYWVGHVTTTSYPASGPNYKCDTKHPGCLLPEDLFFDGVLYQRMTTQSAVAAGKWYLDTSTGNVYLTANPTGHQVQISTTHFAIYAANVSQVTVSNLIVDKYSPPGGFGAISGVDPTGASVTPTFKWTVSNVEVRNCHGAGIELGNHMTITQSFLHHNGEYGVGGTGNSIGVSHNEISYNNQSGFLPEVGAGTKFNSVVSLTVSYNNIHDNLGAGISDDNGSSSIVYAFNTLQNNLVAGILHEIGGSANIHDNTSTNDGNDPFGSGYWYGAGISIANSSNTKVYNNTLTNDHNGILEQAVTRTDCASPCLLKNNSVYGNTINQSHSVQPSTAAAGILMGTGDPQGLAIYTSSGNTFGYNPTLKASAPNTYNLTPSGDAFFVWEQNSKPNVSLTEAQWQALGNN